MLSPHKTGLWGESIARQSSAGEPTFGALLRPPAGEGPGQTFSGVVGLISSRQLRSPRARP